MLKVTKKIEEANLITHGGKFHADDVFATAFLTTIIENPVVCRVNVLPDDFNSDAIVYDIGYGEYDHHMNDFNLRHNNGVKYASFGLVWKKFGLDYLNKIDSMYAETVYVMIEHDLVEGIDAVDNGEFPQINVDYNYKSIDTIIGDFNKTWDEDTDNDIYFKMAVELALKIFATVVKKCFAKAKAKEHVELAIEKSHDHVLFLDQYMPFKDFVINSDNPKAKDILFAITPSNREGYTIHTIPRSTNTHLTRCDFPAEWGGLVAEELQKKSGVKSAIFCHSTLFMAVCNDLDDAFLMARNAIENNEKI